MKQIPVYRKKEIVAYALVDDEDYEEQSKHRWGLNEGYVRRNATVEGKYRTLRLAREIVGEENIPEGMQVDHTDRNKLNNRHSNLRIVTRTQNSQNQDGRVRAKEGGVPTSQYRGVSFHKQTGKWMARCKIDRTQIYIGLFDTEIEAAIAAYLKRKELMPFTYESEPQDMNLMA